MTLAPGTRLGPYEIAGPLGAGGMGEVYRAKDTRLGRSVAIKILTTLAQASPEARARFEREARTISSLNHPNICTLFDVGHEGGTDFLVLELIEGDSLAARLERGALPVEQALRIGIEISEALDRAHRAGIVHRDLKPGNVMLTKSGAKLMDFGLARSAGLEASVSGLTQSPTVTRPLTAEGTIVGTFQYMAPEQLEGKEADARTDVFALGAMLYEMATGRRAFEGQSQASLIAAILKEQPRSISELQPVTPRAFERVVARCLAKEPDERWQSARDVAHALRAVADGLGEAPGAGAAPVRRASRVPWVIAPVAFVLGVVLVALLAPRTKNGVVASYGVIAPPENAHFASSVSTPIPLAVSPDGSRLAYCARIGEGPVMLCVRSIGADDARVIPGTETAEQPFFSPDGKSIGFFASGKLRRVDADGGPIVTLAAAPDARGGTWNRRGVILFVPLPESGVFAVPAEGGAITHVTELDTTLGEATHRFPWFLPDGEHFLYLARRGGAGSGISPTVYVGSLLSKKRVRAVEVPSNATYASGHLLFARDGKLVAQPFDTRRLRTTGAAVQVVDDVQWDERYSRAVFSASQNGVLACMTGRAQIRSQLRRLDRAGRTVADIGEPADYTYGGTPEVSADGTTAAMAILNETRGSSSVWLVDLASGVRRRLTVCEHDHPLCVWSPDPRKLVVLRYGTPAALVMQSVSGGGGEELIHEQQSMTWITGAARSANEIVYHAIKEPDVDLFVLPLDGEREPVPVAAGRSNEAVGALSPDGRFVAYASDESGRNEIYATTYPPSGAKWQISSGGGDEPRWGPRNRELFYFDPSNHLNAVPIAVTADGLVSGAARALFQFRKSCINRRYDVMPDGSGFLVCAPLDVESSSRITLLTDWTRRTARK